MASSLTLVPLEDIKANPALTESFADMLSAIDEVKKNNPAHAELFGFPEGFDRQSTIDNLDGAIEGLHKGMFTTPEDTLLYAYIDKERQSVVGMTGYLLDRPVARQAEGFDLIHPSYRGQGLGSELMADRLALATQLDSIDSVLFKVHPSNMPSLSRVDKLVENDLAILRPDQHTKYKEFIVDVTEPKDWHGALGAKSLTESVEDTVKGAGRHVSGIFSAAAALAVGTSVLVNGGDMEASAKAMVETVDFGDTGLAIAQGNTDKAISTGIVNTIVVGAPAIAGYAAGSTPVGVLVAGGAMAGVDLYQTAETMSFYNSLPPVDALPQDAPRDLKYLAALKQDILAPLEDQVFKDRMNIPDMNDPGFFKIVDRASLLEQSWEEYQHSYFDMKDRGELPAVEAAIAQAVSQPEQAVPQAAPETQEKICARPSPAAGMAL